MTKEQKFYKALQEIFIGAKIEGEGGFINLMRIKSSYYSQIEKHLNADIDKALREYPKFREELFDKLYSFFSRYFTESGSIYFNSTPFHNDIYEKVYTDDRDVILFWKTQMLYYVKTDRIFRSMPVEFDELKFYFDASTIENKKANEKRSLIFELKQVRDDGTIIFTVKYSERGKISKIGDILKILKKKKIIISEEQVERAFGIFGKQSEVDFFINKNAKDFLQEQFKLWSYQYFWIGAKEWSSERVNELQILKDIAYKIIDFISQFENELVKIWNKPKFVRDSNYLISLETLNKFVDNKTYNSIRAELIKAINIEGELKDDLINTIKENYKLPLQKIYVKDISFKEDTFTLQYVKVFKKEEKYKKYLKRNNLKEIKNLDVLDRGKAVDGFTTYYKSEKLKTQIPVDNLYLDTKYFDNNVKQNLLINISKENNLTEIIDGYLIKGENYQVLNTIKEKLKGKIDLIYNDRPFNTKGVGFSYLDKFKDSTWLTMINDRIQLVKQIIKPDGSFYLHQDHNCNYLSRYLILNIFGFDVRREIIWNTSPSPSGLKSAADNWIRQHDTIFYCCMSANPKFNKLVKLKEINLKDEEIENIEELEDIENEEINNNVENNKIGWLDLFVEENNKVKKYFLLKLDEKGKFVKIYIDQPKVLAIGDVWNDIYSMMYTQNMTRENWGESNTQKPENLLRRIIQSSTNEGDWVIDFYLGTGTTATACQKLNRKWIGIDMGSFIDDVVIQRLKTVLIGDTKTKLSEDINWKGGGFIKYYTIEQYEDTLKNSKYENSDLFNSSNKTPYEDYVFMKDEKMLKSIDIDFKKENIKVDLSKLYPDIDIPETLSNLMGKWIKKIRKDEVEFVDGTKIDTNNIDYKIIKPLIWW